VNQRPIFHGVTEAERRTVSKSNEFECRSRLGSADLSHAHESLSLVNFNGEMGSGKRGQPEPRDFTSIADGSYH
jgi:hypothetical protein